MENRRFVLYFAWDRAKETTKNLGILDNRYPTLFELRRFAWPALEALSEPSIYNQEIDGFLDNIVLSDFAMFCDDVKTYTGTDAKVVQRSYGGKHTALTSELLGECDTLIVISLDHDVTNQSPEPTEIESVKEFLKRPEACLIVCPHHAVGKSDDFKLAQVEHNHHNDILVPSRQCIGNFGKEILHALNLRIENKYGLRPASDLDTESPAGLQKIDEIDDLDLLEGVDTFNLHPHLPHFEIAADDANLRVLARQKIDTRASIHPFVEAGNQYFNAFVWCPPTTDRAGNILVCDATLWSKAFGGLQSLKRLWKNIIHL